MNNGTSPASPALVERTGRPMTIGFPTDLEWQTIVNMAGPLVKSGLLPKAVDTEAKAVAIMLKGRELGLPPMYALSNINVIQGKPVCNAELMLAIIYRDLGSQVILNETPEGERHKRCVLSYTRPGWPERKRHEFTWDDAVKAGLTGKDSWKGYPDAMLRARCISAVARMAFPDLIGGLYTQEEIESNDLPDGAAPVVRDITPQPTPAEPVEDEAADKSRLAADIQDLCVKLSRDVPASTRDWVTLGTALGLPAITKSSQMSVVWLEQVRTRLEQQRAASDAPIGHTTAFVKYRDQIEQATIRHTIVTTIDDAALDGGLAEGEYDTLNALAETRFESLPETEEATVPA